MRSRSRRSGSSVENSSTEMASTTGRGDSLTRREQCEESMPRSSLERRFWPDSSSQARLPSWRPPPSRRSRLRSSPKSLEPRKNSIPSSTTDSSSETFSSDMTPSWGPPIMPAPLRIPSASARPMICEVVLSIPPDRYSRAPSAVRVTRVGSAFHPLVRNLVASRYRHLVHLRTLHSLQTECFAFRRDPDGGRRPREHRFRDAGSSVRF